MPILPILLATAGIQCKTKEDAQELMRRQEKLLMKGSWAIPYLQLAKKEQKPPEPFWEDYGKQGTICLQECKNLLLSSDPKNWRVKRKSKTHFKK